MNCLSLNKDGYYSVKSGYILVMSNARQSWLALMVIMMRMCGHALNGNSDENVWICFKW